ncbi:uncharacterized protein METZ01_LOCUS445634, partial [marine metagenome]
MGLRKPKYPDRRYRRQQDPHGKHSQFVREIPNWTGLQGYSPSSVKQRGKGQVFNYFSK